MKLKQNKDTTTLAVGDIDAKSFKVDTSNGVIFDILRNKMYSNKIAAVAREISSNSRDANRENGKTDTPIEISIVASSVLLNATDMQIMFKDYGVGITPDRMDNIFLKYGASSKRNTNKQTGGFGLGAKTPFAYTDTFTIITVCDYEGKRTKYVYTASITDRAGVGSGEMILFSTEETTEPTGTTIVVPVKESDRMEFEREIYRATCFWKVQPKFEGFETKQWKFKTEFKGKGFFIVDDQYDDFNDATHLLIIDGIPYAIDRGQISGLGDFLCDTNFLFCLEFKNGELTISANREAVQYDRMTKIKILWKIRQAKFAFRDELNAKFAACKTYLDACVFANQINSYSDVQLLLWRHAFQWLKMPAFSFNGRKLAIEANFLYHDIYRYKDYDANGKLFGLEMNKRSYSSAWQLPIYLLTSGKRHTGRNATLIDQGGFILVVPKKIELKDGKDAAQNKHYKEVYDKAIARQVEEMKILEGFGVPLREYNTVIPKVMPKGQSDCQYYKKTNDVNVQVRSVYYSSFYKNWDPETITFLRKEKTTESGAQYIYFTTDKLSNFADYALDRPKLPAEETIQRGIIAAQWLGIDLVCVAEHNAHYFAEAQMLTIDEAWKKVETDQAMIDKITEVLNFKACCSLNLNEGWFEIKLTGRVDPKIEAVVEMLKKEKTQKKIQDENVFYRLDCACTNIKATIDVSTVRTALSELYKKYPLLEFFISRFYTYDSSKKPAAQMNEIMDIIDSQCKKSENNDDAVNPAP